MCVHKYSHIHKTHATHTTLLSMILGVRAGGDMKSINTCIDEEKVKEFHQKLMTLISEMKSNHEEHLPPFLLFPLSIVCSLSKTVFGSP